MEKEKFIKGWIELSGTFNSSLKYYMQDAILVFDQHGVEGFVDVYCSSADQYNTIIDSQKFIQDTLSELLGCSITLFMERGRTKAKIVPPSAIEVFNSLRPTTNTPKVVSTPKEEQTKVCKKCGRELPLSEFSHHVKTADGYRTECKSCHKASMSKPRKVNVQHEQKKEELKVAYEVIKAQKQQITELQDKLQDKLQEQPASDKSAELEAAIAKIENQKSMIRKLQEVAERKKDLSIDDITQWLDDNEYYYKIRKVIVEEYSSISKEAGA